MNNHAPQIGQQVLAMDAEMDVVAVGSGVVSVRGGYARDALAGPKFSPGYTIRGRISFTALGVQDHAQTDMLGLRYLLTI